MSNDENIISQAKRGNSEWNRAIPEAGYIKLRSLRYGIRLSSPYLSEYTTLAATNHKKSIPTRQISSSCSNESSRPSISSSCSLDRNSLSNESTDCFNTGNCCCIGNSNINNISGLNRTKLPISAKNRTSSPSLAATTQQTNITNKSSLNFKRETSPTVCCYYKNSTSNNNNKLKIINNDNNSYAESHKNNINQQKNVENLENSIKSANCVDFQAKKNLKLENSQNKFNNNCVQVTSSPYVTNFSKDLSSKSHSSESDGGQNYNKNSANNSKIIQIIDIKNRQNFDEEKKFYNLKEKIRKFEYSTNNNRQNNKNRSTITTNSPQENLNFSCIGENTKNLSRTNNKFVNLENENDSACDHGIGKFLNDNNSNRKNFDNQNFNKNKSNKITEYFTEEDGRKITKVIIKSLTPILKKKSFSKHNQIVKDSTTAENFPNLINKNSKIIDDDFGFIDSLSTSSNNSNCSDLNLNLSKNTKILNSNYDINTNTNIKFNTNDHHFTKQNKFYNSNCSYDESTAECDEKSLKISPHNPSSTQNNNFGYSNLHIHSRLPSDKSITMEKQRRHTLDKLLFGRKSSASSQENKPHDKTSKTERLRELTEKLKGHRTSSSSSPSASFSVTNNNSKNPPIPPPRRFKHTSSIEKSDSHSPTDSICSTATISQAIPEIPTISTTETVETPSISTTPAKQKSPEEKSSIFNVTRNESLYKLLRPNTSVSNLENIGRSNDHLTLNQKSNSTSLKEEELFTKLARPESRTIVGSYIQRSIPFRSASFSQVDYSSGKYKKPASETDKKQYEEMNEIPSLGLPKTIESLRSSSPAKIMEHEHEHECSEFSCNEYENQNQTKYPLKSELSINLPLENEKEDLPTIEQPKEPLKPETPKNFDILEKKLAQINIMQANEMTLETLIEEGIPMSASSKIQNEELQTATTCLIPIPVFECVEKEWSPLPENNDEEFCHPVAQDVLPESSTIDSFVNVKEDETEQHNASSDNFLKEDEYQVPETVNSIELKTATELSEENHIEIVEETDKNQYKSIDPLEISIPIQTVPEVELNDISIKLDEITANSVEDVCSMIKTQIPQNKDDLILIPQKSVESLEEIRISPEIQEVLETVAETLNEEHKFLTAGKSRGSGGINIVSLICPEADFDLSDRDDNSKMDYLKAESSPEPSGSFDRSDSEYKEVRKRHSNNESHQNSGSDKSSPSNSPNSIGDEKRRIDKSKRRKGIYIQWPAIEKNNEQESDSNAASANEDKEDWNQSTEKCEDVVRRESDDTFPNSPKSSFSNRKLQDRGGQNLELVCKHADSICSNDTNTPDSDYGFNKPIWPKTNRRQSLTYQSSDEKDDPVLTHSPSYKPFRTIFLRSESVSDNESDRGDRGSSRDRTSASPAPNYSEQDLKRYSKRPLRGPYGQMLEAEMKKPNKMYYDELLEELSRNENHKKSNCSLDETNNGFFSRHKTKKSGGHLPIPIHTRTVSSPVPLIETSSPDSMPVNHHKRYPSSIDQRDTSNSYIHDKKLSLDSYLSVEKSPKRTSSDITDKHSKKNAFPNDRSHPKRSLDEIRIPSQNTSNRNFILTTPETPKNIVATPELLAQLLKGSSEKLLNEQTQSNQKSNYHHSNIFNSSGGIALPTAVLKCLDTRTHVVVELYNTEKSYFESLQTLITKYLNPLKLPENSGIIDTQIVDEIFFMVPSILNVHQTFFETLSKRLESWDSLQRVGDAFVEAFSSPVVLETYTSFVNNWNKAKDAIRYQKKTRPAFAKFLDSRARDHKGKLSLDNLLIKPVQKFPNYELIFQRLIKHTDADHPDQKPLQDALKLVHDILLHLNCKEREALENGQREAALRELEGVIEGVSELVLPDRSFLLFELVSMPSGQAARKERGLFLFSDLLVITSVKKRSGTIRKPNTVAGSITSTLDTNKYKFLTKISLDDLEIVKSKDENVRKIMKEIENLTEDSNKLQQISEITSNLHCSHQILEDAIKDLQREVQRQLSERQTNDSQLNLLELTLNSPNGIQNMSVVFSKPEKRSQWEEIFTEAKQKLIASLERYQVPEFLKCVPIRKTRAGLQFMCGSATLGSQKDVWVCNSDGYVGQVCVLSLNQPEPTVTSINGVCNARILCVSSVPAILDSTRNSVHNLNTNPEEVSLGPSSNSPSASANKLEKKSSTKNDSNNIRLDSSSSEESENENQPDRSISPTKTKLNELNTEDDESNANLMWLGTEDGHIHVYNCTDNIRIKKNKIKIQHVSAVYSILYLDNRVFVSLANGDICVYGRDNSGWNIQAPLTLSIGTVTSPVTKLLNVNGKLWCAVQGSIKILNTASLQVENQIQISTELKPITNMAVLNNYVWISIQNSAIIKCCHAYNFEIIFEVNLAPSVNKMLSNCDDIIREHKAACLRITSLLACEGKDLIFVGTSAGVLLTIMAQNVCKGSSVPVVTGISHGHTGHVRFLTSVEIFNNVDESTTKSPVNSKVNNDKNITLIISGGDGYEDFRNSGGTMSEIAGREDSTNHLILWQL